jgi:hypothetical protein
MVHHMVDDAHLVDQVPGHDYRRGGGVPLERSTPERLAYHARREPCAHRCGCYHRGVPRQLR